MMIDFEGDIQTWWESLSPIRHAVMADVGNGCVKMALLNGQTCTVMHRMAFLTDSEYDRALARFGGRPGAFLMRITPPGGCPQGIIVGEEAESYDQVARPEGAARYIQEYYGFLFINMVARMLPFSTELYAFVSHAPRDFDYRREQRRSILGEWVVQIGKETRNYFVRKVWNYDEPFGGFANLAFNPDGSRNMDFVYFDKRGLFIDIGELTTDWMVVNPGAVIDTNLVDSVRLGIGNVVDDFTKAFRAKHARLLQTGNLRASQIYQAIRTGSMSYNGYEYDCTEEIKPAMTRLTNQVRDTVRQKVGGFGSVDYVGLTGGGSWMSMPYLIRNMDGFNAERVMLVTSEEKMRQANALGGIPLYNFGVITGAIR